MNRDAIAAALARSWPRGVCHFCELRDEQVDGDRHRWLNEQQNVCSATGCVIQMRNAVDRAMALQQRGRRKLTPPEVHELKMQKIRKRRQKYRAKQAQRKGRAA